MQLIGVAELKPEAVGAEPALFGNTDNELWILWLACLCSRAAWTHTHTDTVNKLLQKTLDWNRKWVKK